MNNLEQVLKKYDEIYFKNTKETHGILHKVMRTSIINAINKHEQWYVDKDICYCGKCKQQITKKEKIEGMNIVIGIMCKCDQSKKQAKENEKIFNEILLKKQVITSDRYKQAIFENEKTRHERPIIKLAKKYCEEWNMNYKKNIGLLFTGDTGTGKTWTSYCIANYLINKNIKVEITNFPNLFAKCKEHFNSISNIINKKLASDCLIIDDFGVEALTEFNNQIAYQIIDKRYHQMKPIIVSTNLTINELISNKDMRIKRITSRLIDMCSIVEVSGNDLRFEQRTEKS